jgi:hypothetical protein
MLKTVAYFKHLAASSLVQDIINQCNQLISADCGLHVRLSYLPDLLVVAKTSENAVASLLILHFTVGTGAWEIGAMSTKAKYNRDKMLELLINSAEDAIRALQRRETIDKTVWLVKRVSHSDSRRKALFSKLGFEHPDSWVENVLSNTGYIPFDPFDSVLMKRTVQA